MVKRPIGYKAASSVPWAGLRTRLARAGRGMRLLQARGVDAGTASYFLPTYAQPIFLRRFQSYEDRGAGPYRYRQRVRDAELSAARTLFGTMRKWRRPRDRRLHWTIIKRLGRHRWSRR